MGDNEFRDVAALFAMLVTIWGDDESHEPSASECFAIADAMLAARNKPKTEGGIAAIKKRRERTK